MNSTALGAEKENINFISEAHEKFYEKNSESALCRCISQGTLLCIGMNEDTEKYG